MADQYKQLQLAVDELLNTKTTVRRKKKKESEKQKEMFVLVINTMEEIIVRSNIAVKELQVDLFKYEEKFINVIDLLMYMNFGSDAVELISHYLYDRTNDDGSINPIYVDDVEVYLESPYQLWDIVARVKPITID